MADETRGNKRVFILKYLLCFAVRYTLSFCTNFHMKDFGMLALVCRLLPASGSRSLRTPTTPPAASQVKGQTSANSSKRSISVLRRRAASREVPVSLRGTQLQHCPGLTLGVAPASPPAKRPAGATKDQRSPLCSSKVDLF